MNLVTFLRRLSGRDESSLKTNQEFQDRLNGVDAKNAELDKLNTQLDELLDELTYRQSQISVSFSPVEDVKQGKDNGLG